MMKNQTKRDAMVEKIFSEIEEELAGYEKKLSIARKCATIDNELLAKQSRCIKNLKITIDTLKRAVEVESDLFVEFFNKGYYQPTSDVEKFKTKHEILIDDSKSEISKYENENAKEILKSLINIRSESIKALLRYRMDRCEIMMNDIEIESQLSNVQSAY